MHGPTARVGFFLTILAPALHAGSPLPRYEAIRIGGLDGVFLCEPRDISDSGHICGASFLSDAGGYPVAVAWYPDRLHDPVFVLGVGNTPVMTLDVNNHGLFVGQHGGAQGFTFDAQNGLRLLDDPSNSFSITQANAVNDHGQIVGHMGIESRAAIWNDDRVAPLPMLEGALWSTAMDINESGVVLGSAIRSDLFDTAVMWHNGVATDLAPDEDRIIMVGALNERGHCVGTMWESDVGSPFRAFVVRDGVLTMLPRHTPVQPGTLDMANDINDAGQIVGSNAVFAVTWIDDASYNLNDLLATPGMLQDALVNAYGINNYGEIVTQTFAGGGVLLRPIGLCPGDADGDRDSDFDDLNLVLGSFGTQGPFDPLTPGPDRDHNGVVDFADLNHVLSAFGSACPSSANG